MDASRSDLYTGGERLTCSLEIQPKLKHDVAVPPRPRRLDSYCGRKSLVHPVLFVMHVFLLPTRCRVT